MNSGVIAPASYARDQLVERYEELRASVLGLCLAPRWGLTVALRQGLARWMRAVGETNAKTTPEAGDEGSRPNVGPGQTETIPVMRNDIIAIVAQMVAWQLKRGHLA